MLQRSLQAIFIGVAALALFACGDRPRDVDIAITVTSAGQPLNGAQVMIDGKEAGVSNAQGQFQTVIKRKYGDEISINVDKEVEKHHTPAWTQAFTFKSEEEGGSDKYTFNADIKVLPFIAVEVKDGRQPVEGATVRIGGKAVGQTNKDGVLEYDFETKPGDKLSLAVSKKGFYPWEQKVSFASGTQINAALDPLFDLQVTAVTDNYGTATPLQGIDVYLGEKHIGTTDAKGVFRLGRKGLRGKTAQLVLSAPGFVPQRWNMDIKLAGVTNVKRYFYPNTTKPVRIGLLRFIGNTAGEGLGMVPTNFQSDLDKRLASVKSFETVSAESVAAAMKESRLDLGQAQSKGWRNTPLEKLVDVIAFGSVSKGSSGDYMIETKFIGADGQLLMTHLASASNERNIDRAARATSIYVAEQFPIEGRVVGQEGDDYTVSIQTAGLDLGRKQELTLYAPKFNKQGRINGYNEIGALKIDRVKRDQVMASVDVLKDKNVPLGSKVIRRTVIDGEGGDYITISAKGGVEDTAIPLRGVNVYIGEQWIAATGRDGKARVPVRLGKAQNIVLYRHGYEQLAVEVTPNSKGEVKEFVLNAYNSIFKVDSNPSGIAVLVDEVEIGTTPITKGVPVTTGFHKVKLTPGGDYREWEKVIDFNRTIEDRTGQASIVLHKDFLKLGENAEKRGDIEAAITAYLNADKDHPDYAEARHRAGAMLLDERKDYAGAIREFENVIAVPEVKELIFKQFAIAYTNLGHAYYEQGNALLHSDTASAAKYLAKAIKTLDTAKTNSRFFPAEAYDRAIHDTYYYLALSYHKLYQITKKGTLRNQTELAWRNYIDFFPESLETQAAYRQSRESADEYLEQLRQEG